MLFSHSLSFRFVRNRSKLTIFNSFNFVACEFSVESFRMEIFRVFEGLATSCLTTNCKHIEDRLKKDGVLTVGKRRLFPKKRRVSGAKTSFFDPKDFVFFRKNGVLFSSILVLAFGRRCFCRKQARNRRKIPLTYLFCILILSSRKRESVLCNFVNSTMKKASMGTSKPGAYSLISFSSVISVFFGVKLNFFQYHINQIFHRFVIILAEFALCSTCNDIAYCQCPMSQHRSEGIKG